jgi:hypothetical protein
MPGALSSPAAETLELMKKKLGSLRFQKLSTSEHNHFLDDCSAAESASKGAVGPGTNSKQTLAWKRYQQYLQSIDIFSDPFLDNFTRYQHIKILSALAQAIHESRFNRKKTLLSSSLTHVEPPLIAWHRPTTWQIDLTQDLMKMGNYLYIYSTITEHTNKLTNQRNNKSH